ncbi:TlpA family protein disulfide reductase [Microtetraspora malaysiensis]|uniref:TlpA family protein disulfide reductase n=1 Tax=Microtetraspora malaysiensis TaxID=161358 RepID=UPI00082F6CA8|nr:redoxin domain-containing protein [Microtetraspora malaysiensis]
MEPYLIAIVILVGIVSLLSLLLCLAVIRRLREHTKLIDALYEVVGNGLPSAHAGPSLGDVVGEFDATTVDGDRVARDLLPDGTVVAFLSPECRGCREQLPELAAWAAGQDRARVLAVVDGHAADPAHLVTTLAPVARVVIADASNPVARAFGVESYPTFFEVAAGGRLLAMEAKISRLPAGTAA